MENMFILLNFQLTYIQEFADGALINVNVKDPDSIANEFLVQLLRNF